MENNFLDQDVSFEPNLAMVDLKFKIEQAVDGEAKEELKSQLLEMLKKENMSELYGCFAYEGVLEFDLELLENMKDANKLKLNAIEMAIDDAGENLGETEVRDFLLQKANYLCHIGSKDEAVAAYNETLKKTVALGQKLDITFTLIRMGFFFNDQDMIKRNINKANSLMDEGSDWDRRNRLKIYEASQAMLSRKMERAASLLIETLSTFNCYEMFDFEKFIFYTVISSLVSLDRVSLYKKVICSPEVRSVLVKVSYLDSFLNDYYNGEYEKYFKSLLSILEFVENDRMLARHSRWLCREFRIKAYSQFLESYISVQLSSMAKQFGITVKFLDQELAKFICTGRLNCKIDIVNGIVETNRPNNKNHSYEKVIKQGDLLLNRIQKLAAKVINL